MSQRKLLFLYPETLTNCTLLELDEIMKLSEDLDYIANDVNEFVKDVTETYLTKETTLLPKIECLPVSDFKKMLTEFHDVRVCLVKYNDVDYSSCYTDIVKTYHNNQQDISHLISLTIDTSIKDNEIFWNNDCENNFDVNVKTNLNQLNVVLTSIIMDIIFYRYFKLSDDLTQRKSFSELKRDYILALDVNTTIKEKYGNNIS